MPPTILAVMFGLLTVSCTGAPAALESGSRQVDAVLGYPATVERVVDGDTIIVTIDGRSETVRLLGIDTPEKPGGPRPGECFGTEASAHAGSLLPAGTDVLLTRDHEARDQYARLLAYVHRADDGVFINLTMVQDGYATTLFFAPNTSQQTRFEDAANAARREWRGFWPGCGGPDITLEAEPTPPGG